MRPAAAAAVLLCAAPIGCGGSEPDLEGAREAAVLYVEALRKGDGEDACEQLSKGAVAEIEQGAGGTDCAEAIGGVLAALGSRRELEELRITEVNVAGRVATATLEGPRGETVLELRREGGEWRLTTPGG